MNKPLPRIHQLPRSEKELKKKYKNGMYDEMPKIQIGRFEICMMSDKEGEDRIWVRDGEEEAGEFKAVLLESYIEEFFNKYF